MTFHQIPGTNEHFMGRSLTSRFRLKSGITKVTFTDGSNPVNGYFTENFDQSFHMFSFFSYVH